MKAKELLKEELSHKVRTANDLIQNIYIREESSPNYSVFLGAGASVTSGIRSASTLIEEWLIELYERFKDGEHGSVEEAKAYFIESHASWYNPAHAYSSLFEKKYDLASQRRRFVEKEVDGKLPSIGYAYLTSLVDSNFFNTIFTSNFDDLINEAFYQFSNVRPILCAHDSSIHSVSITSKRPKIIKLHGDYLFDDIKSTLRETESLEQNTKEKLIEFCKEGGLVVVGYSGSDRSVMDVLEFLAKQDNYLKNGIYWCLREDDEITHALRNLLWKDKVYPVIIEGFDEFFAKAHKELVGRGLEIESHTRKTKLKKTIDNIVNDRFNLSRDEIISNEISSIKMEKNNQDISRLMSSLESNDGDPLSLSRTDFRNLLEVEDLIQKGDLSGAYSLCETYFRSCEEKKVRSRYIYSLIRISEEKGDYSLALKWSDSLIELDVWNSNFYIEKSKCIKDVKARFEFLDRTLNNFPRQYGLLNSAATAGLRLIKSDPLYSGLNYQRILEILNESLRLEPSLSNPAWNIKLDLFSQMKRRKDMSQDCKVEIDNLVKTATSCNPENVNTLALMVKKVSVMSDYREAVAVIKQLYECSSRFPENKKKIVAELLNEIVGGLSSMDENDGYGRQQEDFYENYLKDIEIKDNCPILLGKANYFAGQKRQMEVARDYLSQALICNDACENLGVAIRLASAVDPSMISKIKSTLANNSVDLSLSYFYKLSSEIAVCEGLYKEAKENIRKAYENGLSIGEFLTGHSYILLRESKYDEVLALYKAYKDYIVGSESDFEPFILNNQLAAKRAGNAGYDEVLVRNMSAKSPDVDVRICAFSILGNNSDAKRLIRGQIKVNYLNYFAYKEWPAIDEGLLEELDQSEAA